MWERHTSLGPIPFRVVVDLRAYTQIRSVNGPIYTVWFKKTDPLVYFDDNFGKYGPTPLHSLTGRAFSGHSAKAT